MMSFVRDTPLPKLAAQLMGSRTLDFFYDHVIVKKPCTDAAQAVIPWHQDLPYWNVDGAQIGSAWVPLDEVTGEAGVTWLLGSHKWGLFRPRHFVDASPYEGMSCRLFLYSFSFLLDALPVRVVSL
jgi:ectoine hydroxylase-related dioxygenase (phytanoyl-CoA dioxygenase family)